MVSLARAVAVRSGNPEIGRSGIQNNNKWLIGGSNGDVSNVFVVSIVKNLKFQLVNCL